MKEMMGNPSLTLPLTQTILHFLNEKMIATNTTPSCYTHLCEAHTKQNKIIGLHPGLLQGKIISAR